MTLTEHHLLFLLVLLLSCVLVTGLNVTDGQPVGTNMSTASPTPTNKPTVVREVSTDTSSTVITNGTTDATSSATDTSSPTTTVSAAPAPSPNKGDTAWMLTSTALVLLMSVPALALYYGGLVRSKNMTSVLMQVLTVFSMIIVLWCIYGYSLAFTEGNMIYGGWSRVVLIGTFDPTTGGFSMGATFSKATPIYELVYVVFQATFAAITVCLVIGALVERVKFTALIIASFIWFNISYLPIAHMAWFWMGPDAYTNENETDAVNAQAGLFWQWGVLDYAGGTVVHINSGVAGMVGCIILGRRRGLGKGGVAPHSLTMTMVGASMLWFGWFGFNAGSALEANGFAALAFTNTFLATACAVLSWIMTEWIVTRKPSLLAGSSGAVSGLVAITPAAGNVGTPGAFIIGTLAGVICCLSVHGIKWATNRVRVDDALDCFAVHGVGGIFGALATGIFNSPVLLGPGFTLDYVTGETGFTSIGEQFLIQLKGVAVTIAWSGLSALIAFKFTDLVIGLRVTSADEEVGLDMSWHGEPAYHFGP